MSIDGFWYTLKHFMCLHDHVHGFSMRDLIISQEFSLRLPIELRCCDGIGSPFSQFTKTTLDVPFQNPERHATYHNTSPKTT